MTSSSSDERIPYVGILNQGNTCYLSAAIQALFHLPEFRRRFYALSLRKTDAVALALRDLFALLEAGCEDISTVQLTTAFGWSAADASTQHDVHELLQQLFDALEVTVKGTDHEAFIRDIFQGLMAYRSRATDVEYVADRVEAFYDVELVVKNKSSIEESLKAFSLPEKIEGVSLEVTPGAKPTTHTIERVQSFLELPPVLLIHPNRAAFDMETFELVTLTNEWEFSEDLEMADYVLEKAALKPDPESKEMLKKLSRQQSGPPLSTQYELQTVIIHAGDTNIGHYYCYTRHGEEWLRFNDELVDKVSMEDVKRSAFGGAPAEGARYSIFRHERASLLVYVNKSSQKMVLKETPPPDFILERARAIDAERKAATLSRPIRYIPCTEKVVDVLDGVYGALAEQTRSVVAKGTTDADRLQAYAADLGVATDRLRVLRFEDLPNTNAAQISLHRLAYLHYTDAVQILPSPRADGAENAPEPFVALFRVVAGDRQSLSAATVVDSRAALSAALPAGWLMFVVGMDSRSGRFQMFVASHTDEVCDGSNVVCCPPPHAKETIELLLSQRRFRPINVRFVEPIGKVHDTVIQLRVDDGTPYAELQSLVFNALSTEGKEKLPMAIPTKDHIGFFMALKNDQPDLLPSAAFYLDMDQKQCTLLLCDLLSLGSQRNLFFTVLPAPLHMLDVSSSVILNLGWSRHPIVYLLRGTKATTLLQLADLAAKQLGRWLSPAFRKCLEDRKTKVETYLRVLIASGGRILNASTFGESTPFSTSSTNDVKVLDKITQIPGCEVIDVCFCNRRTGENYFGFPTNVSVSSIMSETSEKLLERIAKKLELPEDVMPDVSKKWRLSVRSTKPNNSKICTASRMDVLSKLVEEVGGKPYMIVIDRPRYRELDRHDYHDPEGSSGEKAIVIKSTSTQDLDAI